MWDNYHHSSSSFFSLYFFWGGGGEGHGEDTLANINMLVGKAKSNAGCDADFRVNYKSREDNDKKELADNNSEHVKLKDLN